MPVFEEANKPQSIIGDLAWGRGKMLGDYLHSVKLQLPRNRALSECGLCPAILLARGRFRVPGQVSYLFEPQ
jgi:hypothetical protein